MVDLEAPLEPQIKFYEDTLPQISFKNYVVSYNKFDTGSENLDAYKKNIKELFENKLRKKIIEEFVTVAINKEGYEEYIKNCLDSVVSLCEWDSKADPFDAWISSSE